jgi:hypothetical protein
MCKDTNRNTELLGRGETCPIHYPQNIPSYFFLITSSLQLCSHAHVSVLPLLTGPCRWETFLVDPSPSSYAAMYVKLTCVLILAQWCFWFLIASHIFLLYIFCVTKVICFHVCISRWLDFKLWESKTMFNLVTCAQHLVKYLAHDVSHVLLSKWIYSWLKSNKYTHD